MSTLQHLPVTPDEADLRLDRWFKRHFPSLSHVRLEKLLRTGQVRVDGGRVKAAHRLVAGMVVRVPPFEDGAAPTEPQYQKPPTEDEAAKLQAQVLYRDDEVIVLNKPAGLAVQGGTNITRHLDGMLDALKFDAPERPKLVHRLDKETSGVLLLGRSAKAAAWLAAAFREQAARKVYWALVAGIPKPKRGRIDLPVGKDGEDRDAVTYYTVIEQAAQKAAWLALMPRTGRTHQLRIHCAAIGTPIVGDDKHGAATAVMGSRRKLHLHARSIVLRRPNGSSITATAPLPPHMESTWSFFGFDTELAGDPFADLDLD